MGNLFDTPARRDERALVTELLDEMRQLRLTATEQLARWQGGLFLRNDVLEVATRTFESRGYLHLQYHVPAGSIEVSNHSTHTITVVSGAPQDSAPVGGRGVYVVAAGVCRTVNVASREITLYGTSGDVFSFQVLAVGTAGRTGLNAVDGGGAS